MLHFTALTYVEKKINTNKCCVDSEKEINTTVHLLSRRLVVATECHKSHMQEELQLLT
jgi:hypothetical protein